jgi:predicted glycoside hydrolase/deacetylase ChbG (UPF0249 family)
LIIHADDAGLAPSINVATLAALRAGDVSSASIIAVGRWVGELDQTNAAGPSLDLGVHLTLTSESPVLRLAPAAPAAEVPSLVDSTGMLRLAIQPPLVGSEVETELRAQIARVRRLGIRVTHLDSHQGTLFKDATAFAVLRRVAKSECLPILLPRDRFKHAPFLASAIEDGQVVVDRVVAIGAAVPPGKWLAYYERAIRDLRPGLTELIVHLGAADDSSRSLFRAHVTGWDAAWRQRDADAVASPAFRRSLQRPDLRIINWGDIGAAMSPCR